MTILTRAREFVDGVCAIPAALARTATALEGYNAVANDTCSMLREHRELRQQLEQERIAVDILGRDWQPLANWAQAQPEARAGATYASVALNRLAALDSQFRTVDSIAESFRQEIGQDPGTTERKLTNSLAHLKDIHVRIRSIGDERRKLVALLETERAAVSDRDKLIEELQGKLNSKLEVADTYRELFNGEVISRKAAERKLDTVTRWRKCADEPCPLDSDALVQMRRMIRATFEVSIDECCYLRPDDEWRYLDPPEATCP